MTASFSLLLDTLKSNYTNGIFKHKGITKQIFTLQHINKNGKEQVKFTNKAVWILFVFVILWSEVLHSVS